MKKYPFHLVTGPGKGVSYSSLLQVGDLSPAEPLGQAKVRVVYNITNNNITIADRALEFPEMKEHLVLGYCFNSQSPAASAWRLPIKSFVPPQTDWSQPVVFTEADGHETTYTRSSEDPTMYFAPGLKEGTPYLKYDPELYQWYWYHPKTQVGEIYSKNGQLTERRDAWGNRMQFKYTSSGQLDFIYCFTSGNKYSITRTQNSDGSRSEVISRTSDTDPVGHVFQLYEFDKSGLLITSTTSLNGRDFTGGYKAQYDCSIGNPLILNGIKQDDGTELTFQYVSRSTGQVETIYSPTTEEVRTDFAYSPGKVGVTVKGGWKADFLIDTQSRVIQKDQYINFVGNSYTIESTGYAYAPEGQLQKIMQPDGGVETFTYSSPFGLLTQHKRPNGQQNDFIYDIGQNRPLLTTQTVTAPDSKTPVTTYYVNQRQVSESKNFIDEKDYFRYSISPEGRVIGFEPTAQGPIQFKRQFLSSTFTKSVAPVFEEIDAWQKQQNPQAIMLTEYTHNGQGLETGKMRYVSVDEKGNGVVDSQMSQINHSGFDDFGAWSIQEKELECDDKGQAIATAQTNRKFDGLQRSISIMDPMDNLTTAQYGVNDDKDYDGVYTIAVTKPNQRLEKTILDAQGDPINQVVTVPIEGGEYSKPQWTHWNRDSAGRPVSTVHPDDTITFQAFYNDNYLGLSITATGIVTEHQIDRIHNFECDIEYKNQIDATKIDRYQVDGGDIKKSIVRDDENDRYTYRFYDSMHRLCFAVDAKNQPTEYRYDDLLDVRTAVIVYQNPLADDQIATMKTGKLITLTPDSSKDRWTSYYYDNDKIPIGQIDSNGWVTENILDNAGRVTQSIRYSTPNRAAERSSDFAAMRPVKAPSDAITYFFYNARGQTTVSVDPENYLTATIYYASEKVYQTTRYYNRLDKDWDTTVCPPLPKTHSEDRIITLEYDALEREVNTLASNSVAKATQYTNMGKICLQRNYDTRFSGTEGTTDSDQTRTEQKRYDGWDNVIQTANSYISQQLAEIESDSSLTPEQKQEKTEDIWKNNTQRDQYDEIKGFKLKTTDSLNRTTIFYYDQERRLVLAISPLGVATKFEYSTFHETVSSRRYFNKISSENLAALTGGFIDDTVSKLLVQNADKDIVDAQVYDKLSQKISYTDPDGFVFTFKWSGFHEIVEEQKPLDESRKLTIQHEFDTLGKEISTTSISASGEILTAQASYENIYGKLTQRIDEAGAITKSEYDRVGNETTVIDSLGITSHQREFDALRRLLSDKDAEGQTTQLSYDQTTRTVSTTPPVAGTEVIEETNIFKEPVARTDALSESRTWEHNPFGQVTFSVNELGLVTKDVYDSEKQHTSHIDPIQTQTSFSFNEDGYQIQQVQTSTAFKTLTTQFEPDSFGRQAAIIDPRGITTLQDFTKRGLLSEQVRDPGTPDQPGLQLKKSWTYNGLRTKLEMNQGDEKDGAQYTVTFQQDDFNRSAGKTIDPQESSTGEKIEFKGDAPLNLKTSVKLDKVGQVSRHIDALNRITYIFKDSRRLKRFAIDHQGGILEWQYNDLELKSVARTYDTALTPEDLATITDETTLAQIETLVSGKQSLQDTLNYFFYDGNRREKFKVSIYQESSDIKPQGIVVQTDYDGANRRHAQLSYAKMVDASDIAEWTTESLTQLMAANTDLDDRQMFYINDAAGQGRFAFDSRGVLTESRYDDLGRVIGQIQYARLINPNAVVDFNEAEMEQYVAKNIADPTQDRVKFKIYNLFNEPNFVVKSTLGNACSVKKYLYDEAGNLTSTICFADTITFTDYNDLCQQLLALNKGDKDRQTFRVFDNGNRLIESIDALGFKESYQRDALDNLTTRTDQAGYVWQNSYDRAKRLITEVSPSAPVTTTTQSDNGLTVVEKTCSVKTVNQFDGVNNLVQKTIDADGDEPRIAITSFSINNKPESITVPDVEVDDPAQAASLKARPVVKKDLTKTTVFNAKRKKVVQIDEQDGNRFWVYDSLGRLTYEINTLGYVTGYRRNNFNEVVVKAEYAIPLINLNQYKDTGIPLDDVLENLKESSGDRYTYFDRNLSGDAVSTITGVAKPPAQAKIKDLKGLLFYYYPPTQSSGYFYAQTNRDYDAFRRPQRIAKLITPNPEIWSEKYHWLDAQNNVVAVAEAVQESGDSSRTFRVTRRNYSAFNQKIAQTKYAGYFAIDPENMSLADLDAFLASQPDNDKNQTKEYEYDLRGSRIKVTRKDVYRSTLTLGTNNVPTFITEKYNLTESYDYEARGLKTITTHEHIEGQPAPITCSYYDERGLQRADTGVTFTTEDEKGEPLQITPLTFYGVNAHGQRVKKIAYINGAEDSKIDPDTLPIPKTDPKNDAQELKLTDNRGKISAEQNANNHVESSTFTATGQQGRRYWQRTNYGEPVHVDEKRQSYDLMNHPTLIDLRRDNITQQMTAFQYNAFGETTAEGPGTPADTKSNESKSTPTSKLKSVPAKATATWPLYRIYAQGQLFSTNDQKTPAIHLYDLTGAETATLVSPTMDLSVMTPDDVPALLQKAYSDIEKTQTARDPASRALAQILPDYMAGQATQPQFIPLEILASTVYPALGSMSLSWPDLTFLNASPIFWIYPAGDDSKKTQLTVKRDSSTERCGVDVSAYQTGTYDVQINFYLIDPITGQPGTFLKYYSYAHVNFPTTHNDQTTEIVATVQDDHTLFLTGNVSDITAIDLIDAHGLLVQRYPLKEKSSSQKFVDLPDIASGFYQAKPVSSGGVVGAPTDSFVINTSIGPIQAAVLSREITATAELLLEGNQAELVLWQSLPLDFRQTPVIVSCEYTDTKGNNHTITDVILTPDDPDIIFDNPVQNIVSLSVSLQIDSDEIIPLYIQAAPKATTGPLPKTGENEEKKENKENKETEESEQKELEQDEKYGPLSLSIHPIKTLPKTAERKAEKIEEKIKVPDKKSDFNDTEAKTKGKSGATINFASQRVLYLRGSAVNVFDNDNLPVLQYKDVSQNLQAAWGNLNSTGATYEGLIVDVSTLQPGNYPFILPHGDQSNPFIFTIALGAQVFDSQAAPPGKTVSVKTTPSQRQRRFKLDVFDNQVATTNTLDQTTEFGYNDLRQRIEQLDPPVEVVDSDNTTIPDFRGKTTTYRNVDGVVIGTQKPAGNTEGFVLDEQNRQIAIYQGDGLRYRKYVRDGFGREIRTTDPRGLITQRVFDPMNNILQQTLPNNDPQNNNGAPLTTTMTYDEKTKRSLQRDPAGNQTRYLYDINDNISCLVNPKGDRVNTWWDRNHQRLYETLASGASQQWTPDPVLGYFSVMESYVDLGGARFTFEFDFKLQNTRKSSSGGNRGNTAILTGTYNPTKGITIYKLNTDYPTPDQNLGMRFDAGRLVESTDYAQDVQTVLDYDSEDRPIMKGITSLTSAWSPRQVTSTINALGYETNFFDTSLTGLTQYDRNGNRRRRIAQVIQGGGVVQSDDNVYLYDAVDRSIAVDCGWSGKNVILTKSSSMLINYQQGLRWEEITQNGTRSIGYWADGNISQIKDTDGSLTSHHYHPAGYRQSTVVNHADGTTDSDSIGCDPDLFQTSQISTNKDGTDQTTLTPDPDNNILNQNTIHIPSDGSKNVSYKLNFSYVRFEDTFQNSVVDGTTSDSNGKKMTQAQLFFDSNGITGGKIGSDNDDKNTNGKLSDFFLSTSDGTILEKAEFPTDTSKMSSIDKVGNKFEYYFYDIAGNYLSSYTVTQMPFSTLRVGSGDNNGMKLRYEGIRNSGRMGPFSLEGQPRTASNQSLVNSRVFVVQPVKSYSHRMHETASTFGSLGATSSSTSVTLTGGNTGGNHDEAEFVQPITKVDDWTVPDRYTVKPGDTYASIAQSQYGDPSFGSQIALNNNDPEDTIQPSSPSVLKLPQYVPKSNRATNYLPEEKFNNAIIGNIYPPLIFAQPHRHKHSCVQTLVSVAISVVVMVAASALVGACPAAAPFMLLAHSLEVAMVAAILDAGAQAVAVKLGALKEFSIQSMIETSLAAGAFYGMSMAFKNAAAFTKLATQTAAAGAGDLSSQLVEMATGLRKRLDIRQTLLSMATTLIDTPLNDSLPFQVKVNDPRIGRKIVMALMDDFADAYANAYVGSAIMGGKPDLEDALGQALGSFFGSQIGDWIQSHSKPVLGWGTGAEVTNDNPIHDYHSAVMDAKPDITYQDLEEKMGIHDLEDEDFTQDLTSDSNKPIGSDQAPKSSAAKPSASVAPPNSYVTNQQLAQRQLAAMLTQNMQGYFPDSAVFNTVPGYTSASNNPQLLSMMLQIMNKNPLLPLTFSTPQLSQFGQTAGKLLYQMMYMTVDQAYSAVRGVDLAGNPVGLGMRAFDVAMTALTLLPVAGEAGLLAKTGFFALKDTLLTGSESLTSWVSKGAGIFRSSADTELDVYHTASVGFDEKGVSFSQSVLDGINTEKTSAANRFGKGFYLSENPETSVLEVIHGDRAPANTIRYIYDPSSAKVLDLTNPITAKVWGYQGGEASLEMIKIAGIAKEDGYNVIRFNSERGAGVNYVVFENFEQMLKPQMISPAPIVKVAEPEPTFVYQH